MDTERNPEPRSKRWPSFAPGSNHRSGLPRKQVLTLLVLFFFGFQFSRFYLATPLDHDFCPEPSERATIPMGPAPSQSSGERMADPSSDGGPFFQHCKDYVYGISLTPLQALTAPAPDNLAWTQPVSVLQIPAVLALTQNELVPPFHPPRHLS
jgi:hypothetical protein